MTRLMSKDGKKTMGVILGEEFIKHVVGSKHQLRVPPAWAMDKWVFDTIKHEGVRNVVILDTEKKKKFVASLELFDNHGFKIDRGYGEQIALELKWWKVSNINTVEELLKENIELRQWGIDLQEQVRQVDDARIANINASKQYLKEAEDIIRMLQVREQDCLRQLEEIDDTPVLMEGYSNG